MNSGVQNSAGLSVIACTGTKMEQTSLVPRPSYPAFVACSMKSKSWAWRPGKEARADIRNKLHEPCTLPLCYSGLHFQLNICGFRDHAKN